MDGGDCVKLGRSWRLLIERRWLVVIEQSWVGDGGCGLSEAGGL